MQKTYGGWAAEVAKSQGAFFMDLNELVAQQYEALGQEKVSRVFLQRPHADQSGRRASQCRNCGCRSEEIEELQVG